MKLTESNTTLEGSVLEGTGLEGADIEEVRYTEVLVLGSGVAGLSVALGATPRSTLLVTKGALASGSSPWAQGGIAAAMGEDDSPLLHAEDTERVARGLGDAEAIAQVTGAAPAAIERLLELGARFDLDSEGELALGREGGHARARILHAGGDRTGAEVVRVLSEAVRRTDHVEIAEHFFAVDFLLAANQAGDDSVVGVVGIELSETGSRRVAIFAEATVLATGGLGQLYAHTTNPAEVTGDGMAMAARAGARLLDMEFVQFHPTSLAVPDLDRLEGSPLLTEALRGAGGHLIDEKGERFVAAVLPEGELAARDQVARTIVRHRAAGHETFLDVRHLKDLERRFPTLIESCEAVGIDPLTEPVPVSPAAHYTMGGVAVDAEGRTSLPGLWAAGEVTSSGVHGANRLASNSLLEGLVFGSRVGAQIEIDAFAGHSDRAGPTNRRIAGDGGLSLAGRALGPGHALRARLRSVMWKHVALERDAEGLTAAGEDIDAIARDTASSWREVHTREAGELRNMVLVARLVTRAALRREESRGGHYRTDFPRARALWQRRLALRVEGNQVVFEGPIPAPEERRAVQEAGA